MRAPPCTLEVVEARARLHPRRAALHDEGVTLDYAQFANLLLQCARHLQGLGVRRGDRVAVGGPGFGIQLVVLLAAEALGAVTASFRGEGDTDAQGMFPWVGWVFAGIRPPTLPPHVRFGLLDQALVDKLAQPFAGTAPAWEPAGFDEHQRLTRTSGSSGQSKFMLLRRQAQESWIHPALDVAGYDAATRLLLIGPLVANAIYGRASDCLREGGLVMMGQGRDIASLAPTHIHGLPLQLETLLAQVPLGYAAPQPVNVTTMGGFATADLRMRTAVVFGQEPGSRYGSNEAHIVCVDLDVGGTGVLCPGVDVRILDDDGRELPPGQAGVIAVRTPALADGYLGQPELTAAAFRDGWFVSGDAGAMVGPRRLQLLGRHDDLLNLGGIKVPTMHIENLLRAQAGVRDAAVLSGQFTGGATVGVALVLAPDATADQGRAALRNALSPEPGVQVRALFVAAIPRLAATGKVDRMALMTAFRQ